MSLFKFNHDVKVKDCVFFEGMTGKLRAFKTDEFGHMRYLVLFEHPAIKAEWFDKDELELATRG